MFSIPKLLLIVGVVAIGVCCAGDRAFGDELPVPQNAGQTETSFPLEVSLLGYIQRHDSTTALILIGSQTLILRQGETREIVLADSKVATRLEFKEIDFENRSIRLGFPNSLYLPQTCRMKGP